MWLFVYKVENIHKILCTTDKIKQNLTTGCDRCVIYLFIYLFIAIHLTTMLVSVSAEQNEIFMNCSHGPDIR